MAGVVRRKDPKTGRVLPDGVSYRRNDDRYIYKYVYAGKTKYLYAKDLTVIKKKIEELNAKLVSGINLEYSELRLNDYYPLWLEIYKKDKLKQTGYNNYESYFQYNYHRLQQSCELQNIVILLLHPRLLLCFHTPTIALRKQ